MKTGKLVLMFITLLLASSVTFGQNRRNIAYQRNGNFYGPGHCLNVLTDLTDEQKEKITEMETSHQEIMAELRIKQRSTYVPVEKNAIRGEMLEKVQEHRKEVRKLLTEEQKKQYDALHAQDGFGGRRYLNARYGNRRQAGFGRRGFRGGW